jgi:hypothetical protein
MERIVSMSPCTVTGLIGLVKLSTRSCRCYTRFVGLLRWWGTNSQRFTDKAAEEWRQIYKVLLSLSLRLNILELMNRHWYYLNFLSRMDRNELLMMQGLTSQQ